MFAKNYLDDLHGRLLLENYTEEYLSLLNENNFKKVYSLFEFLGFYYIDDIIVRYLEIFMLSHEEVLRKLLQIKERLGDTYVIQISNNLSILKEVLE